MTGLLEQARTQRTPIDVSAVDGKRCAERQHPCAARHLMSWQVDASGHVAGEPLTGLADVGARELVLADGERVRFELLLAVPPHRPPEVVRSSKLASETGYISVDAGTLATRVEGVYAIGDVTTIPVGGGKALPKAGVFANGEAEVVARRIAAELAGQTPSATFDGSGSCFVELGGGRAAMRAAISTRPLDRRYGCAVRGESGM